MAKTTSAVERQVQILRMLREQDQPLTSSEICRLLGLSQGSQVTLNKILGEMVKNGQLSVRKETAEERMLRAGQEVPLASRRAALYSHKPRVPARTAPSLFDDLRPTHLNLPEEARRRSLEAGRAKRERSIAQVVEVLEAATYPLLVSEIAALTEPHETTVRDVINELAEQGRIAFTTRPHPGIRGGRPVMAVSLRNPERAMPKLDSLLNEPCDVFDEPAPVKPEVNESHIVPNTPMADLGRQLAFTVERINQQLARTSELQALVDKQSEKLREKDRTITRQSDRIKGLETQNTELQTEVEVLRTKLRAVRNSLS